MPTFRYVLVTLLCSVLSFIPAFAHGQEQGAQALVQSIVTNELKVDANDHSLWMFRDQNKAHGKSTVKLVVQTPQGEVSKTIEINGHALTPQQKQADKRKIHRFITDPAVRRKQKQNQQQDDKKAASLTRMLPEAFLWAITGEHGDETTLAFKPNPKFNPPTREARVFAAMKGTMVVNTRQKRIKSLKGTLIRNVEFGWGLLGKLEKGGTFNIERQNIGPGVWEITATHVHIQGHALIFKSISEQQDEVTSDYKPSPPAITLAEAAKMLIDGTVAKDIGAAQAR
ncbi:MAG: hypothetical protein ACRD28_03835 [Acidobacteriaceae bacterium]